MHPLRNRNIKGPRRRFDRLGLRNCAMPPDPSSKSIHSLSMRLEVCTDYYLFGLRDVCCRCVRLVECRGFRISGGRRPLGADGTCVKRGGVVGVHSVFTPLVRLSKDEFRHSNGWVMLSDAQGTHRIHWHLFTTKFSDRQFFNRRTAAAHGDANLLFTAPSGL